MKLFTIHIITSFLVSFLTCILVFTEVINLKKILPEDFFEAEKKIIETKVPNFMNLKIADAEKVAEQLGLKTIREEKFLENIQPDIVLNQFPLPGYKANKGDAVKLVVSKAIEITIETMSKEDLMNEIELTTKVLMPDITGLNSATAIGLLNKAGVKNISKNFADDDLIDKGKIINFNPPAGSEVDKSAIVDIIISKGASVKFVIVPNLYNKSLESAKNEITKNNLKLGKVKKITDIDKGFNKIIGQSIQWGEKVKAGTVIDIDLNEESEESVGW
ncbi:MAG: PASTA domain-containing protein [Candidatus Delongbacteria bacterium]|nr:PASTA domain-containing protein [Candidatus Delongbacteria bacterium]